MHYEEYTDLHMAVSKNGLNLVITLCTPDNVNDTAGDERNTPLMCAALKGVNLEIISHLINMGCDINIKDTGGDSALFIAALAGKQKVVEFLLLKGAEIDQDCLKRSTAFLEKKYPEILLLLQDPSNAMQSSYSWMSSSADSRSIKQRIPHSHGSNVEMISLK